MTIVESTSKQTNEFPQTVKLRTHVFSADVGPDSGSEDTAPGPHDYFDTALATCKALTAIWYARKKGMPLERVETRVESDGSQEREGIYKMRVRVIFHGPLSDEQREQLNRAIAKCPVHKLMTAVEVQIETES